jgi:hypothetical protein
MGDFMMYTILKKTDMSAHKKIYSRKMKCKGYHIQQKLHKPGADTSINHRLDLVIRAIREIRKGPACIS